MVGIGIVIENSFSKYRFPTLLMDNSKTEKQLHRELKYEGKKVRQREKKKEDGIFKKQRLFDEPNKPASSRQLPNEPRVKRESGRNQQNHKLLVLVAKIILVTKVKVCNEYKS